MVTSAYTFVLCSIKINQQSICKLKYESLGGGGGVLSTTAFSSCAPGDFDRNYFLIFRIKFSLPQMQQLLLLPAERPVLKLLLLAFFGLSPRAPIMVKLGRGGGHQYLTHCQI